MSYLQQILGNAQQNGGLTDDEFNSIFQQFMPQQQPQANMGLPQQQPQQVQRPQGIPQTQVPMQWGAGVNTANLSKAPNGVEGDDSVGLMENVRDQYNITQNPEYNTDMFSTQTQMLAEQERGMNDEDDKDKMKNFFSGLFGQ